MASSDTDRIAWLLFNFLFFCSPVVVQDWSTQLEFHLSWDPCAIAFSSEGEIPQPPCTYEGQTCSSSLLVTALLVNARDKSITIVRPGRAVASHSRGHPADSTRLYRQIEIVATTDASHFSIVDPLLYYMGHHPSTTDTKNRSHLTSTSALVVVLRLGNVHDSG